MGSDDVEPAPIGPLLQFSQFVAACIHKPVIWFRESILKLNQQKTYWYHRKYPRVPTIDQCYEDDTVCIYEANEQYLRDREVEKNILHILRRRSERCGIDNQNNMSACDEIVEYYKQAINNYFIKYGELGVYHSAFYCYMKQKHRLAWERRHGPLKPAEVDIKKEDGF